MNQKTYKIVGMGILTALVIVLQVFASAIKFGPFSITLTLIPIVVGSALYGWKSGAWLGAVFGAVVIISGDAAAFLSISVIGTILTCILKGALAGTLAGLTYKALEKKNKVAAAIASAIICPVVNTGVFLIGSAIFFLDAVREWGAGAGYDNVFAYMIVAFVGLNFLVELGINLILSPSIVTILNNVKKPVRA